MNFPSDSVNDFLRRVQGAKAKQREVVETNLDPLLSDPATFAVDPALGRMMDDACERYGDEAYKQVAMVAIGKWLDLHNAYIQEHVNLEDFSAALFGMADATKLTTVLRLMEEVGSFGGDDDYRQAMREQINQAVLEGLEEAGRSPEDFFYGEGK
jgi:hypothetical protein